MSRSIKKGPYVQEVLLKRVVAMNEAGEKKVLKTWSRSSTIFPDFVGHTFAVHDGRKHVPVYVTSSVNSHRQELTRVMQDPRHQTTVRSNRKEELKWKQELI